jgi:hypothetical protein
VTMLSYGVRELYQAALGRRLRSASIRLAIRMSPRASIEGFEVAQLAGNDPSEVLFGKVRTALGIISRSDPRRFKRLQQDVRRILLLDAGEAAGMYWHELRACVLDLSYIREFPPEYIASTLVHEGTHARLRRRFRYPPQLRKRIEALCISQEIRFASRLPGAAELIQDAERRRRISAAM